VPGRLSSIRSVAPQLLTSAELIVETPGEGFSDITAEARRFVPHERRPHDAMLYRRGRMQRRALMRTYAPLLGFVYVPLGILALALGSNHGQAAAALFVGAAFALLWFLGSLHARIIRYDPDGFFASIVVLGGASFVALQAAALGSRSALVAAPSAACAATVIIGSSLAALGARKVRRSIGRLGIAGGIAVLGLGLSEGASDWTFVGSTFWASSLGFMIWVLITATYLVRS